MLEGINILIVEDNILNQKVANFMLLKQKATIQNATNGKQAIELLKKNHFDVVLMDLQMPEMDGFAATKYIRNEMNSNVPIIGATADMFTNDTPECLESGMNLCVVKPFDVKYLTEVILNLVKEIKSN